LYSSPLANFLPHQHDLANNQCELLRDREEGLEQPIDTSTPEGKDLKARKEWMWREIMIFKISFLFHSFIQDEHLHLCSQTRSANSSRIFQFFDALL